MINQLKELINNFNNISEEMGNPDVINNIEQYTKLAKEHRRLAPTIEIAKEFLQISNNLKEDEEILKGNDIEALLLPSHQLLGNVIE